MATRINDRMVRFGLWYDFRNPSPWRRPVDAVYTETFAHIRDAEDLGFDDIWTSEHHFVDDGYSPSLLPICGAIAASTRRVRIGTNVLLLPLHDPLRVAEDAATIDAISGGRFDLGVANGYRVGEFEGMHIDRRTRSRRIEEAVTVIRRAWSPGPFSLAGRFYQYSDVDVTPKPVQDPAPLWMGGFAEAAVRRAARIGDGLLAAANVVPAYLEELAKAGKADRPTRIALALPWAAIADDPDAAWQAIGPHVLYQRQRYAEWFAGAGTPIFGAVPRSADEIRDQSPDIVVTPQRAASLVRDVCARVPVTNLYWWAIPPGVSPMATRDSMELFMRRVLPLLA